MQLWFHSPALTDFLQAHSHRMPQVPVCFSERSNWNKKQRAHLRQGQALKTVPLVCSILDNREMCTFFLLGYMMFSMSIWLLSLGLQRNLAGWWRRNQLRWSFFPPVEVTTQLRTSRHTPILRLCNHTLFIVLQQQLSYCHCGTHQGSVMESLLAAHEPNQQRRLGATAHMQFCTSSVSWKPSKINIKLQYTNAS